MSKLETILNSGQHIILSGPYGTEFKLRNSDINKGNPMNPRGPPGDRADTLALGDDDGRGLLQAIAAEYIGSIPISQPLIVVTPSFRLTREMLAEITLKHSYLARDLPREGFRYCVTAQNLCVEALSGSGRNEENTSIAMSIGPPFNCYYGQDTPRGVDIKYLSQTFVAVRFLKHVGLILYETGPSLRSVVGTARAFTKAHQETRLNGGEASLEILGYIGNFLEPFELLGNGIQEVCPTYNPSDRSYRKIENPSVDYIIYFCVKPNGTVYGRNGWIPVNEAINQLFETIDRENLIRPKGIGFNCNELGLTIETYDSLSSENARLVLGVHPNATTERDIANYEGLTHIDSIPIDRYVPTLANFVQRNNIRIVGGCCGTNSAHMAELAEALRAY